MNKLTKLASLLICSIVPVYFLSATSVSASTYYVDATSGSDANNGLSLTGSWKTVAKVNSSTFVPGDSVLFKCGETWRESLVASTKGIPGSPVTYSTYGLCTVNNKPILNAAEVVSGWTVYSGSIYVADVPFAVQQIIVDGNLVNLAHYPNKGYNQQNPTSMFLSIDTGSTDGTTTTKYNNIIDNDLSALSGKDLSGATAIIRTITWTIEECPITLFNNSNQIYLGVCPTAAYGRPSGTDYPILKDWGYYLSNKLWMLDEPGEWYYDASSGKVYVWLQTNDNPSSHTIEASRYDSVISSVTPGSIYVDGLSIKNGGKWGVKFSYPTEISLRNLNIINSGNTGIYISGDLSKTTGVRIIDGNIIQKSVKQGIELHKYPNVTVSNNTVEDSGNIGTPHNSYAGISASDKTTNATINNNTVRRAGYNGINYSPNSLVQNNLVENVCLVLDDCGAIYIWNGLSTDYFNNDGSVKSAIPVINSRVIGNIVRNANPFANIDGNGYKKTQSEGIYLDNFTNGVEVANNTVVNVGFGMHMNNAFNNNIHDNTIFNGHNSQIDINESYAPIAPGTVHGNIFQNNILFPLGGVPSFTMYSIFNDTTQFGTFISNLYTGLYSDQMSMETLATTWPYQINKFSLSEWQQIRLRDIASVLYSPFLINAFKFLTVPLINIITNGNMDVNLNNWSVYDGVYPSNTLMSQESNCSSQKSGATTCIKLTPMSTTTNTALSNKLFTVTSGKTYVIDFSLLATQYNQDVNIIVRSNTGPNYYTLGIDQLIVTGPHWKDYKLIFTATSTDSTARLDFMIRPKPGVDQSIYIDNVSLREVTAEYNDPSDDANILVNSSSTQISVLCPDSDTVKCTEYVDLDSNKVTWPTVLDPYSSKIITWKNNPFKDTTSPIAPSNLTGSVLSSSQVHISWAPSTDPYLNISGYRVYRNSVQIFIGTSTSYTDIGLSASTSYTYAVEAYNTADTVSLKS